MDVPAAIGLEFEGFDVRIFDRAGDPWFVLSDVCRILGLRNPAQAASALDDDERSMLNIGRQGQTIIVSEPGVNFIIMRSRKAKVRGTFAYRFRRWVTHQVLPSIRKYGQYPPPDLSTLADPEVYAGRESTLGQRFRDERLAWEERNGLDFSRCAPIFSPAIVRAIERDEGSIFKGGRLVTLIDAGFDLSYIRNGIRTISPMERKLIDHVRNSEDPRTQALLARLAS